jgi:NAD(P)-dependent dehydrogenase (short-subunit alcohol dehydrogenase family)
MDQFSLEGKVAIITGASRGIGRAIALAFARAGARVALCSRKLEGLQAVAAEIQEAAPVPADGLRSGQVLALQAHVGQTDQVRHLVAQALEAFGRVDVVVNNAATNPHFGPLLTADEGQWLKILDTNLLGAVRLCQAVVPQMKEQGGGKIINMASVAGLRPSPGMGLYGIGKAALIQLTRQLALELGPDNIQVNAITPGIIETRFSQVLWQTPQISEPLLAHMPLGKFGQPEDVAGLALYLASPAADYVTGGVFSVDGGMEIATAMA